VPGECLDQGRAENEQEAGDGRQDDQGVAFDKLFKYQRGRPSLLGCRDAPPSMVALSVTSSRTNA
jgi:hypothetical protein